MEELDKIKTDVFSEMQDTATINNKKFEELSTQIYQIHSNTQENKLARISLEQ